MSDWVTHLGTAYIAARVASIRDVQLVLVGAVLPDLMMPAFVVLDLFRLPVSLRAFAYLLPFQSLTIVSLLAAALCVTQARPLRSFLLMSGGALTHFTLDALETDIDCGMRIFYPISYRSWSPGWLAAGGLPSTILLIVSAVAVVIAFRQRAHHGPLLFQTKYANLFLGLGLSALAFCIPLLTKETMVHHNVHSLSFLTNPARWQGRTVDLCFSEVSGVSPVRIKELGREFELANGEGFKLGDQISLRGVYRDGKVYPIRVYHHRGFSDDWISLIGLLALGALLHSGKHRWLRVD